jgi:hypothetical protein
MRTISWTEFKTTSIDVIRKRESVIVAGDGLPAFIAIIGAEGDMANTIEAHASLIQAGRQAELWES